VSRLRGDVFQKPHTGPEATRPLHQTRKPIDELSRTDDYRPDPSVDQCAPQNHETRGEPAYRQSSRRYGGNPPAGKEGDEGTGIDRQPIEKPSPNLFNLSPSI